jgi:hypothetical protein
LVIYGILRDITMSKHFHKLAVLCLSLAALCIGTVGIATTRADIYQVNAPIADRSEAGQTTAFQAAMRSVLVRVTGRRGAEDDAAFAPLVSNARRYVQQYRSAPDNQIWVSFDGAAIERWLAQNGQPLWGRDRPTTVALVAVQTGAQNGVVLTSEDASDLKAAIDAAALYRGLPLQWPSGADLQKYHIDYAAISGGSSGVLADAAHRMGGDGVLIGRANGPGENAAVRWTHQFQDRSSEYSGSLEGINRAADLYAGLFAASGTLAPVDIDVTGIRDLREYANLETYLESLTAISHVSVTSLGADVVRFRLAMRGGPEALQRALAAGGRLLPVAGGDNGIQRFQLHR